MNRRKFIQALGGGFAASAALPFLPIPAPPIVQGFAFHPNAFALVMGDLQRCDMCHAGASVLFKTPTSARCLRCEAGIKKAVDVLAERIDRDALIYVEQRIADERGFSGSQW